MLVEVFGVLGVDELMKTVVLVGEDLLDGGFQFVAYAAAGLYQAGRLRYLLVSELSDCLFEYLVEVAALDACPSSAGADQDSPS